MTSSIAIAAGAIATVIFAGSVLPMLGKAARTKDLRSYSRWFDYSRARDAMFRASDTPLAPWLVVRSDNKRRARLNVIRDILSRVPYEALPRKRVKLPKAEQVTADGFAMLDDLTDLEQVVRCDPRTRSIVNGQPLAESGGLAGFEWLFTIRLEPCACPPAG